MRLIKTSPKYYDYGVILLLSLIALYGAWLYRDFAQDDAFITYRYARNIANGHGFVYNINEPPTFGTTTPLFTLILAGLARLFGPDIHLLSHVISMLSLWVGAITLYFLGKPATLFAGGVALLFISNPLFMSAIKMETFFLVAVLLLAVYFYQTEKYYVSGLLLGLLILTRYETGLFAALLGLHFLIKTRQLPYWLLSTAAIFCGWLLFALITFGHIVPQSAQAKVAALAAGEGYSFAAGAMLWWLVYADQSAWYYLFLPLLMLGAYSLFRSKMGSEGYGLLLAWSVVYFIGASLVAGSFSWYYGPLIPGLTILLLRGVKLVADSLAGLGLRLAANDSIQNLPPVIFAAFVVATVFVQLFSWQRGWVTFQGRVIDSRQVIYGEVADWFIDNAGPTEILATDEIGVLGYYTDMRIIDLWGLVTPELLPWFEYGYHYTINRAIEQYAPDYVFTGEPILIELMADKPNYRAAAAFDEDNYILFARQ